MRRPPAGSRGLSDDLRARAQAWAERSSLDQQLPVKITDRATVTAVVAILGMVSPPARRRQVAPVGEGAQASDPPDGSKPGLVEAVQPATTGTDDHVVEDGGDDRTLTAQRQLSPSLAKVAGVADVAVEDADAA